MRGPHRMLDASPLRPKPFSAYLILILTGMNQEVSQIKCINLEPMGVLAVYDIQPFDARKGRVANRRSGRSLNTNSSGRVLPDSRSDRTRSSRSPALSAEHRSRAAISPNGRSFARGDRARPLVTAIAKSWRYVEKVLKIVAERMTLCNTPFDEQIGWTTVPFTKRTRDHILGHVTDVPEVTESQGSINANQIAADLRLLEPEIVKQMREILVSAKDRAERTELIVLKPQSKKRARVRSR